MERREPDELRVIHGSRGNRAKLAPSKHFVIIIYYYSFVRLLTRATRTCRWIFMYVRGWVESRY